MNAAASLPEQAFTATVPTLAPVLRVDGVPIPFVDIVAMESSGPLLEQHATAALAADAPCAAQDLLRYAGVVDVAVALQMDDGDAQWLVLMEAAPGSMIAASAPSHTSRQLVLPSRWTQRLSHGSGSVPVAVGGDVAQRDLDEGPMWIGRDWWMSAETHTVNGLTVHLPSRGGGPWSVAALIRSIGAMLGVGIETPSLLTGSAGPIMPEALNLAGGLGAALQEALGQAGLVLRQAGPNSFTAMPSGVSVCEVAWADGSDSFASLSEQRESKEEAAVVAAYTRRVWREGTFALVGGWSPALEGQGASAYAVGTAADYSAVRDVYRYWVLNEDAAFSGPPHSHAAFDLRAFFGDAQLAAQAARLEPPLTRSASGQPMPPLVQFSLDAGSTWLDFDQPVELATDRAALRLSDTLPAGFLAAGESGALRLRVTASLARPSHVEETKWMGNPFSSGLRRHAIDVSDVVRYHSIDPSSVFTAEVAAGNRSADLADDRGRHRQLLDAFARRVADRPADEGSMRLSGFWPRLLPGDTLRRVAGQAVRDAGVVRGVRHVYKPSGRAGSGWYTHIEIGAFS